MAPRAAARCGSRTGRPLAGAAQPAGCVRPDRRRGGAAAGKPGAHASSDWPAPATRRAAPALVPGAVAGYAKPGRGSRSPGRAASPPGLSPNAHADWPASPRAISTRPLAPAPAWPRDDRRVHHASVQHERARPAIAMRGSTRRAQSSSAAAGAKTPWITGTWAGWMQSMPPKPICCALDAARAGPAVSCTPGNTPSSAGGNPAARVCNSTWMRAWSSTIPRPASQATTPVQRVIQAAKGQPRHAGRGRDFRKIEHAARRR